MLLNLLPDRRDAILNAALKEFTLQGYEKASTNVIASEAGISKSLMFHYVSSKKELYLITFDFFENLLEEEYYKKIDYSEEDIFVRLRLSYTLQIELMKKYPYILYFKKLFVLTKSEELNKELRPRLSKCKPSCNIQLFNNIDQTKFRKNINIATCKQFIIWANIGFTEQILNEITSSNIENVNYKNIMILVDNYLIELTKVFYEVNYEKK